MATALPVVTSEAMTPSESLGPAAQVMAIVAVMERTSAAYSSGCAAPQQDCCGAAPFMTVVLVSGDGS
jgi:hypothetical protein